MVENTIPVMGYGFLLFLHHAPGNMKNMRYAIVLLLALPFFSFAQNDSLPAKDTSLIYAFAQQNPEFPGGNVRLAHWFRKYSKHPTPEIRDGLQTGRSVWLKFIVEADGSVSDIKVTKSVSPELDAEAIRLVSILPPFVPAWHSGKAVRFYWALPVVFE